MRLRHHPLNSSFCILNSSFFRYLVAMNDSRVVIGLLALIATFVVGVVLSLLQTVLIPLVVAVFLSYLFKPIVIFLQKRRVPTFISLILVFITIGAVLFGISSVIYASVDSFVAEAPKYQDKLVGIAMDLNEEVADFGRKYNLPVENFDWASIVDVTSVTGVLGSGLGTTVNLAGNVILILLYMAFILGATGDFAEKARLSFNRKYSDTLGSIVGRVDAQVRQYLLTKTLISLATGFLTTIILLIFGVDFAVFWGFLAFVLNYIPNFGSLIAQLFPVLLAFLQFDSIVTPLILLAVLAAMQTTIGNVVEPKVMAFSLDLSPLVVLVALIFWGWLWGLVGMIIAVPMTAILKIIFENIEALKPLGRLMGGPVKPSETPHVLESPKGGNEGEGSSGELIV